MAITKPGIDRIARNATPIGYFRDGMTVFDDLLGRFPFELIRIICDSREKTIWPGPCLDLRFLAIFLPPGMNMDTLVSTWHRLAP